MTDGEDFYTCDLGSSQKPVCTSVINRTNVATIPYLQDHGTTLMRYCGFADGTYKNFLDYNFYLGCFADAVTITFTFVSDESIQLTIPKGSMFGGEPNFFGNTWILTSDGHFITYRVTSMLSLVNGSFKEIVLGEGGNKISVTDEEPAAAHDGDLWIDSDGIDTLESEVVNSLDGNETTKAPSVSAVNNKFIAKNGIITVEKALTTDSYGNAALGISSLDYVLLDICQVNQTVNCWMSHYSWDNQYRLHTVNWNGTALATSGTFRITYMKR